MATTQPTDDDKNVNFQKYYDFLSGATVSETSSLKHSKITEELAREKKLKNDDAEQDIRLKKTTLNRLFFFLLGETIIVFVFAFLQATHFLSFALEEWSFKLLTSVTITQITVMLFVAVSYLFPKNKV